MPRRRRLCSQARSVPAWLALCGSTLLTMNSSRRGMPLMASRDQLFGGAAAVHLGGVDVREAARDAGAQRGDLVVACAGPPPSARSPAPRSAPRPASVRSVACSWSCVTLGPWPSKVSIPRPASACARSSRTRPPRSRPSWRRRRRRSRAGAAGPSPSAPRCWRARPRSWRPRRGRLPRVMTAEMGKLLGAAVQEAEKCAAGCRYYAEHAEAFLRPEVIAESAGPRRGACSSRWARCWR